MKIIFKIISIAIIISILTCNVYTFLYSENQVFLNLSDIEAFAGKEYSSNEYRFHQITIGCRNVSFQAWRQWCCKGSKQKLCHAEDCTGTILYGCSEWGETNA